MDLKLIGIIAFGIIAVILGVLLGGNIMAGWFRPKLAEEECQRDMDETDEAKKVQGNCATGLICDITGDDDADEGEGTCKPVGAVAGEAAEALAKTLGFGIGLGAEAANIANKDNCTDFCDCPEGEASSPTAESCAEFITADTCANFCPATGSPGSGSGSGTTTPGGSGGVTRVQLCNPWKAQDCERAGDELTCQEFWNCYKKHNQVPCGGEQYFKKCGWAK